MISIADLDEKMDFINWKKFSSNVLRSEDGETIDDTEKVILSAPQNLENVSDLIKTYLDTPNGTKILETYILWRLLDAHVMLLSTPFRQVFN